ncbi:MAG: hypothetical protein WB792_01225 [Desulfobacterales bacterium]
MTQKTGLLLFMIFLAIFIAGSGFADEVRLKNGDRLTGKFIRMQSDKLI